MRQRISGKKTSAWWLNVRSRRWKCEPKIIGWGTPIQKICLKLWCAVDPTRGWIKWISNFASYVLHSMIFGLFQIVYGFVIWQTILKMSTYTAVFGVHGVILSRFISCFDQSVSDSNCWGVCEMLFLSLWRLCTIEIFFWYLYHFCLLCYFAMLILYIRFSVVLSVLD